MMKGCLRRLHEAYKMRTTTRRTFVVLASCGLIGCAMTKGGPAGGPGPNNAPEASTKGPAAKGTAAEQSYRREVEERAAAGSRHAGLIEGCGHDIKVVFDWDSIDLSQYVGVSLKAGETWEAWKFESITSDTMFTSLYRVCHVSPELKAAVGRIQTLTFHGLPCDEVPRSFTHDDQSTSERDQPLRPGYGHAITDHGANVDITFCRESVNQAGLASHLDSDSFFKANL